MPAFKRIDGDYTITSINPYDNVIVNTHTLEVNGNLDVAGNLTYINVTELNVKDPFILLNASNTASYPSNSGVLTHTAVSSFAGIRYDATAGQWQISTATDTTGLTGTWNPILFGNIAAVPGGSNTAIQFNDDGSFGGDADFTFDYATGQVAIGGPLALSFLASTPTPWSSTSVIYANTPGSGGTGLYFNTDNGTQDELVSKTKAIVFGIIF